MADIEHTVAQNEKPAAEIKKTWNRPQISSFEAVEVTRSNTNLPGDALSSLIS